MAEHDERDQAIYSAVHECVMNARVEIARLCSVSPSNVISGIRADDILSAMQDRAGQAAIDAARRSTPATAPIDGTGLRAYCLRHPQVAMTRGDDDVFECPDKACNVIVDVYVDAPAPAPIETIAEEINRAIFDQTGCGINQLALINVRIILRRHFTDDKKGA